MNQEESISGIVAYWMAKAKDSLEAAEDELKAGRVAFSVNRIYYACFYTVSAVLFQKGVKFKKHSGVRAAFHKYFVKTGLVSHDTGRFYDELFEARQRGDYIELVSFEKEQADEWLRYAKVFVYEVGLLK
ncbi:MAG: HEPN domain-containing protein [Deltaproteobacteria bacterium]|nr:HEPN domain-containing protein [Deltaproteobacteria bacterium]